MPEKQPTDRKPKAAEQGFTFTHQGKTYRLPEATEETALAIPAELTMDALERPDDQLAETRLALAMLRAAKPSDAAMAALRAMSTGDMVRTLGRWMGDEPGESAGSSGS